MSNEGQILQWLEDVYDEEQDVYVIIMLEEEQKDGHWLYFFIFQTYLASTHFSYTKQILIRVSHIQEGFF